MRRRSNKIFFGEPQKKARDRFVIAAGVRILLAAREVVSLDATAQNVRGVFCVVPRAVPQTHNQMCLMCPFMTRQRAIRKAFDQALELVERVVNDHCPLHFFVQG